MVVLYCIQHSQCALHSNEFCVCKASEVVKLVLYKHNYDIPEIITEKKTYIHTHINEKKTSAAKERIKKKEKQQQQYQEKVNTHEEPIK